jgi:FkbM family methyltransferase
MSFVTEFNGKLPFAVSVTGRKRDTVFRILDPLFSGTTHGDVIQTDHGPISVEGKHPPERFLSYAFFNILKFYKKSDLAVYMALQDGTGKVFIDVGANLGVYSLIARSHGYTTYLVEPEPVHVSFLERNSATLGKLVGVALADEAGSLPLYYEEENTGATSLVPAKGYKEGPGTVPVRTFSSLVADGTFANPGSISLIKVDVEGVEAKTIAGMREFLDSGFRPAIWCEVRGDLSGRAPGSYREVTNILQAYGYEVFEFIDGRRKIAEMTQLSSRGVFDLLFEAKPSLP